jgi:glycosyltransferase involved in cell wall biosynthesis
VTETSVILCVRNGAATIAEQLAALAAQEYTESWELVVVDNGSNDGTVAVVRQWEARLPGVTVVPAGERPGLAYARNVGARAAQGRVLAFCDADDVAAPGWLSALSVGAGEAEMVGGRLELDALNSHLARQWRARPEPLALPTALGYLPYAVGANFAIRQDAFQAAGGSDERFTVCGDDLDLSWRVQRGGGSLLFRPDAIMHYRLRTEIRAVMRQRYRYGQAEALLRKKFSDAIPPVAPRARARSVAIMLARSRELAGGPGKRGACLADASHLAGQLYGSARYRVLA